MNKFIFLDIDGVLNDDETYTTAPYGGTGIDDHHLYQLRQLVDNTGAKIVLSSDWRFNSPRMRDQFTNWPTVREDWDYMNKCFRKFDLEIFDITHDRCFKRGNEIKMWLWRQNPPFAYVILDDLPLDEFTEHMPHLVHTNPAVGLTWEDVWEAQEKLKIIETRIKI